MSAANPSTNLPDEFRELDDSYFSIGQSENYYETLISLGDDLRKAYLEAIRDCAYATLRLDRFHSEPVMSNSLLRDIELNRVKTRLHRLATGQAQLTGYSFVYHFPESSKALTPPPVLSFLVIPAQIPASNIHVIIGRNGVGKTRCFDFLARTFLGVPALVSDQPTGILKNMAPSSPFAISPENGDPGFAGLVTVSFSAFDSKGPIIAEGKSSKRYAYVGLVEVRKGIDDSEDTLHIKSINQLTEEFAASLKVCRVGVRRERWKRALKTLEGDPLFAETNVSSLADQPEDVVDAYARFIFRNLSSGHAVVLFSITRLVEFVEERSLVLIDEPECHLHPPLLAAFVRALSDLLINRNGVAIVATHSPVVLQEVPRQCVWKLDRAGWEARADRPEIETFGENVGVLTREVFGLEVTQTGFHKLISDAAIGRDYISILSYFRDQLGAEGRGLARALSLIPPQSDGEDD